jgi:GAF domain-containing protein
MAKSSDSEQGSLLSRIREYQRIVEAISRIGPAAYSAESLLHHVAAQVSRATHIERVKIMRYRPEKGDLLIEAGVGWREGVVGNVSLAVDHRSPAGRAFQTGDSVSVHDVNSDSEYRWPPVLREHGIVSMLNVPVMINGQTWGVLEIDSVTPATYDEWDVAFMATMANVMGCCLAYLDMQKQKVDASAEIARLQAESGLETRELQHRIKNNLQLIIGYLVLKGRGVSGESSACKRSRWRMTC